MGTDSAMTGNTSQKRARTGCQKCRVRRRKCDEGKPTCQRCKDGGFECRYGTRLSFLDKNAIATAETPGDGSAPYSSLHFVEPSAYPRKRPRTRNGRTSLPGDGDASYTRTEAAAQGRRPGGSRGSDIYTHTTGLSVPQDGITEHFNDDYSSQVDIYGIDTPTNATARLLTHDDGSGRVEASADTPAGVHRSENFESTLTDHGPSAVNAANSYPGSRDARRIETGDSLPQDLVIRLLRHYRYNVAPWLDLGDETQTCGHKLCRIAMNSQSTLESLLNLSLVSKNRNVDLRKEGFGLAETTTGQSRPLDVADLSGLIATVFQTVSQYISKPPASWQCPLRTENLCIIVSTFVGEQEIDDVRVALSWILLRLGMSDSPHPCGHPCDMERHLTGQPDISAGLMKSCSISVPDVLLHSTTPHALDGLAERVETSGQDRKPVLLCAEALNYCLDPEPVLDSPESFAGHRTSRRWKALVAALNAWYAGRPLRLMPMLELGEDDGLFPLITFTNGVALLANQLYHTAMLLMLQNRPRMLTRETRPSVLASPLWHAQRVCGISLNNDNKNNWDLSLVASFHLAAKRMTYQPQQRLIMDGLRRIQDLTGWNVDGLSDQLVREWQAI